jgi:uncharacterized membrane protein YvbJ
MTNIKCPECGSSTPSEEERCHHCGGAIKNSCVHSPASSQSVQGIKRVILIAGTLFVAVGVIGTVLGTWWGPALIFPGVVSFFLGRIWS